LDLVEGGAQSIELCGGLGPALAALFPRSEATAADRAA
jgi:hypothetical protein